MGLNKNKQNFSKKFKKFKKKGPFKPKVKQHVREDEEIKKLQELYGNIPNSRDIKTFDDLPLSNNTRKGLAENKFKVPTEIQKQAIGPALNGSDILGASVNVVCILICIDFKRFGLFYFSLRALEKHFHF